jgi:solute carrier family 35 protein E3
MFSKVYINKSIFSTSSFSNCYVSFVAYHFMITGLILYIAGRPFVAIFKPAQTPLLSILPLSIITCANVISMNIALAYSSILFYQVIRILLTPVTAIINLLFYGSRLPKYAAMALLPACVGVGLVSYADIERPRQPLNMKPTSS